MTRHQTLQPLLAAAPGLLSTYGVGDPVDGAGDTKVQWPELVKELGWPGLHFHDLRANAIVLWIRAEVPLSTVRALAGHASLATTDRYALIARNDLAGAAAQVNSYISRTRGRTGAEGGSGENRSD